jgi:hypothetical protein
MLISFNVHFSANATTRAYPSQWALSMDFKRMLRAKRHFGRSPERPGTKSCLRVVQFFTAFHLTLFLALPSYAEAPTFRDEMDGETPMLRLVDSTSFKLLDQRIERQPQRGRTGAEAIQLQGPAGESAQLVFNLPTAPVISELQLAAMIRSNRPGVQIAARVVLPRSHNSKTGVHHEILVRGGNLSRGLQSEKLLLADLPKLLERQARVARLQTADSIDEREAYVSHLVFLVPGGAGITELSVDWIEVDGILQDRVVDSQLRLATAESAAEGEGPLLPGIPMGNSPAASPPSSVRMIDASPVHRIIQWQGERFEYLAKLGFNAIWISRQPTPEELAEAARLGISLVCRPPGAEELASRGITNQWDPVLAWDLGELVAEEDLEQVARLKQLIQHHDPRESRLTVMTCEQLSRDASRATDAIVLGREVLGTDLTLRDYVTWLGQRQRLARPGTPIWATIESEFSPLRSQQVTALRRGNGSVSLCAAYDHLTALTAAAMSVKCREFVFTSQASLAATDPATKQRARNLELINLRLRMLTPWLATGKVTGIGHSSEPGLSAMVFQAERSHLLIPIGWSRDFRSQQSFHVPGSVSFVVPGVAESTDVYLLTLTGAKRLRHERTTGGLQVSVDSLPPDGLIMLSSDAQAFSQVSQYLRQIAGRAARLQRDITAHRYDELQQVVASDTQPRDNAELFRMVLSRAKQELTACDKDLASGYAELACQRTNAAERTLSQAEYLLRNGSNGATRSVATPLEFSVITLGDAHRLASSLANAQQGPEILSGGSFENLPALLQSGWRHQQLPLPGITSAVRLSPDAPYDGSYCLELEARGIDAHAPISVVPTAPVWISSAPIAVKAGELVEITGMARVPEELIGTVDGLQIIDSLGGPGMATRVTHAPSWQSFRILRAATSDTQLVVSFALSGLGRAQVDNLAVRTLQPRSAAVAGQTPSNTRQ